MRIWAVADGVQKRSEETATQRAEWQEEDMNVACSAGKSRRKFS